jgi:hypothetical protein
MHAPSLRQHRWRLKAENRRNRWTLRDEVSESELGLIEVVAVVRDDERVAEVGGEGACAFGEAPQLEQVRVEAREIGLRPLARVSLAATPAAGAEARAH